MFKDDPQWSSDRNLGWSDRLPLRRSSANQTPEMTLMTFYSRIHVIGLQTPNFMYPRSMSYSVALQWTYKIKIIACCPPHMYVTLLPIRPCRPKCLLFLSSPLAIDRLTVLCCLFCWLSPYLIDVFYSPHVSQACNHIKQPIIHKTINIWNLLLKEVEKVLIYLDSGKSLVGLIALDLVSSDYLMVLWMTVINVMISDIDSDETGVAQGCPSV